MNINEETPSERIIRESRPFAVEYVPPQTKEELAEEERRKIAEAPYHDSNGNPIKTAFED